MAIFPKFDAAAFVTNPSTRLASAAEEMYSYFQLKGNRPTHKSESSGAASNGRLAALRMFCVFQRRFCGRFEWMRFARCGGDKRRRIGIALPARCDVSLCATKGISRALSPTQPSLQRVFHSAITDQFSSTESGRYFHSPRLHLHTWAVRLYPQCTSVATMEASLCLEPKIVYRKSVQILKYPSHLRLSITISYLENKIILIQSY